MSTMTRNIGLNQERVFVKLWNDEFVNKVEAFGAADAVPKVGVRSAMVWNRSVWDWSVWDWAVRDWAVRNLGVSF